MSSSGNISAIKLRVNAVQARQCIIDAIKVGLVPILRGSPGMGKSALVKDIAREFNLKVIDLRLSQCEPTDLLGFPKIFEESGKASHVPMDYFPLEGDLLPEGKDGWLIFLDELPNAEPAPQKAAYKLLERLINNTPLHSKVAIVAAGNLMTDNAFVEEMSTALKSRMIHYEMQIDHLAWLEWATAARIHHYVTSFIHWKPASLFQFEPDSSEDTFPCPRTWEFSSKFLYQRSDLVDPLLRANLAGSVGEGMAREFLGYCKIYADLPSLQTIIQDPFNTPVPEERSIIWAITGTIAVSATESTLQKLIHYVDRFPKEFQVVTLRDLVRRQPNLATTQPITDWISRNALELW